MYMKRNKLEPTQHDAGNQMKTDSNKLIHKYLSNKLNKLKLIAQQYLLLLKRLSQQQQQQQ